MGTNIYSILVEPKEPGNEKSTFRYTFGLAFKSPKSVGPWNNEQRDAVHLALCEYLDLPDEIDEQEKQTRTNALFNDPDRYEFYLDSDQYDDVGSKAMNLFDCLVKHCEPVGMVVHMILTD